ncbi:MAG: flavin reductase family protein [Sulfuricella sp.]
MHKTIEPSILYFGTPVVLISTINEDGTYNLAPLSSAFWLGWRCMIGLATYSKTPQNNPVPEFKLHKGYRYESDKFGLAGPTPTASETVAPPRVRECPVQLEAVVEATHRLAEGDAAQRGFIVCFKVRVQRVHVAESILMSGESNRIDPNK